MIFLPPLLRNPQSRGIQHIYCHSAGEDLLEDGARVSPLYWDQEGVHKLRLLSDFAGDVVWGSCLMEGDVGP